MDRVIIPRRKDRKTIKMSAQCRTQNGLRDDGWITDISADGCCVSTQCLFFQVGVRVVVRPQGMEGLTGTVRWIRGDQAGIEFDSALYAPIVDHLAQIHAAGEAVTIVQA